VTSPQSPGGSDAGESSDPIQTFVFSGKSGDNGGYIYWLGTEGKTKKFENPHTSQRLRITSSGMAVGVEEAVVSRKRGEVVVKHGADVFLCLDLGRSRTMAPTHYTLCHGSASTGFDLLNFTLEGHSKRLNKWVDLAVAQDAPRTLKSPHGVGTWPVDGKVTELGGVDSTHTHCALFPFSHLLPPRQSFPLLLFLTSFVYLEQQGERFRYLRIKSTGPNQRGDNALPICAFEFYGALYRSSA
jgi:hypothetical protein